MPGKISIGFSDTSTRTRRTDGHGKKRTNNQKFDYREHGDLCPNNSSILCLEASRGQGFGCQSRPPRNWNGGREQVPLRDQRRKIYSASPRLRVSFSLFQSDI